MSARTFLSAAILAVVSCCFLPAAFAFDLPPNDGYVTDAVPVLSDAEDQALEKKLSEYDTKTKNQFVVLIVSSVSGSDIAAVGTEAMKKWGLESSNRKNGAVIVVSYDDHKVWIEVGTGLKSVLTDQVTKGIIDTDIVPAFRDAKYADGINAAIDAMQKHISGEYTAKRYATKGTSGAFVWVFFAIFVLLNWIGAALARTKSWWMGGILGGIFGLILAVAYSWWLSVPILIILGLVFDYILSIRSPKNHRGNRGGFGGGDVE